MADEKPKPRFRFGIRTLLVLMVAFSLLFTYLRYLYAEEFVWLSERVNSFNKRTSVASSSPLTEREILTALEGNLASAPPDLKAVLEKVIRAKRIPKHSSFYLTRRFNRTNGKAVRFDYVVLWIRYPQASSHIVIRRTRLP
jgi:hypothetical protein